MKYFIFFQVTYSTYEETCTAIQLCHPTSGLICPSIASGCSCPTTLAANKCDCPTTHYWDSGSSACVIRVSESGTCVVGQDYICNFILNKA